ncbi:MAG: hypothetical protein A3F90_01120 [Deltaproteobacteria bacterium RIFCSPLOWO2_12_FULL_60_19]|nr:MAG: hypothetical protein A3F90_01120 [Deltaproteobacteria bacterium RIFCSPLOWO2_12_FULL_60_19]
MERETGIDAFQTQPCAVCNVNRFKRWRWNGLEACVGCGHVRKVSNRRESPLEKIQRAYFDTHFALQDDLFTRFYETLNNKRRLWELRRLLPAGKLLEIGVGRGSLLCALSNAGYDAEGIDISPEVCAAVQARFGLAVHCRTLEAHAQATPPATYDLVIMCHVLEHIESLSSTLRAVKRMLKTAGMLYLAVPNRSAWDAYLPGWTGYEPYHVHYFASSCLRQALRSTGFEVLYEKTYEPLSGWFNTIVRSICSSSPDLEAAVHDRRGRSPRGGFALSLYNVARIATGTMLSPLRWLQSALGYGEELILFAQANGRL